MKSSGFSSSLSPWNELTCLVAIASVGGGISELGRGTLTRLTGDASGVNSNGVLTELSIAAKLEKPDDGLVSDGVLVGCVSSGNGM